MKNVRNFLLLMFCGILAATSLTSCLNDDDNQLSAEEVKKALSSMAGTYTGKAFQLTETVGKDTIEGVTWISNDSLLIPRFPLKHLVNAVSATYHPEMRAAMDAALNANPTTKVYAYYSIVNVNEPQAFYISPAAATMTVTYGGQEHKLSFVFNTVQGQFIKTTKKGTYGFYAVALYDGTTRVESGFTPTLVALKN